MRIKFLFLLAFLAIAEQAYCREGVTPEMVLAEEKGLAPWFTGPLITPSSHVVPVGYANFEPYVIATDNFAQYNNHWRSQSIPRFWSVNPFFFTLIGLTEKMDLLFIPQFYWNETQGQSATRFGDLPVGLDFQLLEQQGVGGDGFSMKLSIRERFPTGKYQKLDPHKLGTDATGNGSYISSVGLTCGKLFHFHGVHFLSTRYHLIYSLPSRVHVKGFNTYGGGFGTNGYVYPGAWLTLNVGLEYSLTKNWALAFDFQAYYEWSTRFKGNKGMSRGVQSFTPAFGAVGQATVGGPPSAQISLAPAIEYNFNEWVGIIGGCWFTVAGRNSADFVAGVLAINFYLDLRKNRSY